MTLSIAWRRATLACAVVGVEIGASASQNHFARAADAADSSSWDLQAAALYLDSREVWWQAWDRSHKDRGRC